MKRSFCKYYIPLYSQKINHINTIPSFVKFLNKIDSTNSYAKRLLDKQIQENDSISTKYDKSIIFAKKQSAGRGRLGRTFVSFKNKGIYCTLIVFPKNKDIKVEDYTIFTAVAICRVLKRLYDIDIKIKWINDLFLNYKKLGGILCEAFINYKIQEIQAIIIGFGINLFKNKKLSLELKNIVTNIQENIGKKINKYELLANICVEVFTIFSLDKQSVINEYKSLSCLIGKEVYINSLINNDKQNNSFVAKVIDINQNGQLIVQTQENKILNLSSCDVSLHNNNIKYGLIGEKLSHSFSKEIHHLLQNEDYILKELNKIQLKEFILQKDFLALNITIPYKQEVIPYLDKIDIKAQEIGAVNTIINLNKKLIGYNTDYYGLKQLIFFNKIKIKNKKVIILGTGGTSKTAFCVCKDLGAKQILFVSRSKKENCITYQEANCIHKDTQVIINTSPVGMYPNNDECPINLTVYKNLHSVIDVIYNPIKTNLIIEAQNLPNKKIKTATGLLMLVLQAAKANQLFFNKKYTINKVIKIYKKILNKKQNIVLIGMPTSGKSTIGKLLSTKLNKTHIDTDELIQKNENQSIKEIINTQGIQYFRTKEQEIIKEISKNQNSIISCGGGIILHNKNIELLKQNGIIIFINRKLQLLQVSKDRPLSSTINELQKLYKQRMPIYKKYCDYEVTNNGSINKVLKKIIKIANKRRIF